MVDRARTLFVSAATVVVALLVAGCGVPSSGPPVTVETPPPPGVAEDQPNDPTLEAPAPPPGDTPQQTVALYFHAAAADEPRNAEAQVRSFLTPDARAQWRRSDAPIPVVRITFGQVTGNPANPQVPVHGEIVGELSASTGAVEPRHEKFEWTASLVSVRTDAGQIWQISNPREGMWLSTDAMDDRFYLWPVYFARERQTLVPDLRYVPGTLTKDKSRTLLVTWLLAGPSVWLRGRAQSEIPAGTALRGLVVVEGGKVIVDLTAAADGVDRVGFDVLSAQLAWTLRPVMTGTLEVRVEGRTRTTQARDAYDNLNATLNLTGQRPERCIVANSKAQPLVPATNGGPDTPPALRVLNAPENSNVVFAGVADGDAASALVRRDEVVRGRTRTTSLWLGQSSGREPPRYGVVQNLSNQKFLSRPSWSGSAWYVAGDRGLYQVSRQNATARQVSIPDNRQVTAVAVAPDGARIAVVIGRQAYVGPLSAGPSPAIGPLRRVGRAVGSVTDVAWSGEDRVVVAGHNNRADDSEGVLWEVSIDDVLARQLAVGKVRNVPTYIAVRPATGWFQSSSPASVLYGVNGAVYEAFSSRVDHVGAGHAPFYSF